MTNKEILEQAELLKDYVVSCRRKVHELAEPSGTEEQTSAFVRGEVRDTGLPYEMVSDYGLIAELDTGRPGPHIALRADLDALYVPESPDNLAGPRAVVSKNPRTCHACGHDAHTAMLLGAMRALTACRDSLKGVIYFCFEEGEEDGRSVARMLEALDKRKIDTCWAIHVYAGMESGRICVEPGPRMAGAAGVNITVIGRGGHGSRPDMAANPVFCAAAILTNAATAWANQITAGETVTLGVTSIRGGETSNVIPDTATILGSLRFFNAEEGEKAVRIFKSVAEHTAAMNRCSVEFGDRFDVVGFPAVNDGKYSALAKKALAEILPEGSVTAEEPWYASESFAKYLRKYPGVFAHLGISNPECGSGAPHHNTHFDIDENVLQTGLISTLKYTAAVMENE